MTIIEVPAEPTDAMLEAAMAGQLEVVKAMCPDTPEFWFVDREESFTHARMIWGRMIEARHLSAAEVRQPATTPNGSKPLDAQAEL